MPTITSITETTFISHHDPMMGFKVTTSDDKTIVLGILSQSNCCEYFGCEVYDFLREEVDGPKSFIGAELLDIRLDEDATHVDDAKEHVLNDFKMRIDDADGWISLSLHTSRGVMVIIAYNIDNGYYPHTYYYKYNDKEDYDKL